jgi:preprotein translocase subunit SecY
MWHKFKKTLNSVLENKYIMNKIWFTLGILAIYRLLIFLPVPFVNISALMERTLSPDAG